MPDFAEGDEHERSASSREVVEERPAVLVELHDLAVEDRVVGVDLEREFGREIIETAEGETATRYELLFSPLTKASAVNGGAINPRPSRGRSLSQTVGAPGRPAWLRRLPLPRPTIRVLGQRRGRLPSIGSGLRR